MLRSLIVKSLSLFLIAAPAAAAPALWSVTDADSTIYLFGTAHVTRPGTAWQTEALKSAIKASTAVWLEVSPAADRAEAGTLMRTLGVDPTGSLFAKLSPQANAKLAAVAAQYGVPIAQFAAMRPWLAAMTVGRLSLVKSGLDPKSGADIAIRAMAEANGARTDGFDTMAQQVHYLADLAEADQIAFLDTMLDIAATGSVAALRTADAWEKGDIAALDKIVDVELKTKAPVAYDRLVVARNNAYASCIEALLATPQTQFVAIGVGHFVGPDSIQHILSRRGLKVRRIK